MGQQEEKKVKIRLLRDIEYAGTIHKTGAILEVEEEAAKEFCDKGFKVAPQWRGTRDEADQLDPRKIDQRIYRAERIG